MNKTEGDVYAGETVFARAMALAEAKEAREAQSRREREAAELAKKEEWTQTLWPAMLALLGEVGKALTPYVLEVEATGNRRLQATFELPEELRVKAFYDGYGTPNVHLAAWDWEINIQSQEEALWKFGQALKKWREFQAQRRAWEEDRRTIRESQARYEAALDKWNVAAARLLDELQKAIDDAQTFFTFELRYGVVALDEYESGYAALERVMVLDDEPDADGWWSVVDGNGTVEARRIFYPVSLGEPVERKPSGGKYAFRLFGHPGLQVSLSPRCSEEDEVFYRVRLAEIAGALGPRPQPQDFGLEDAGGRFR